MKTTPKYLKSCSVEQEFVYFVQSEGQKLELTEQIKTVPDQGTEAEGAGRVEAEGHKSWAFMTPWQQCDSWAVGWQNFSEDRGTGAS